MRNENHIEDNLCGNLSFELIIMPSRKERGPR